MNLTRFTFSFGVVVFAMGVFGFVPAMLHAPISDTGAAYDAFPRLFGLFPINELHNVVKVLVGAWALIASRQILWSLNFCRISTVVFALLFVFGMINGLDTMFGFLPLHSHNVWFHGLSAALLGYYGYRTASVSAKDAKRGTGFGQPTLRT